MGYCVVNITNKSKFPRKNKTFWGELHWTVISNFNINEMIEMNFWVIIELDFAPVAWSQVFFFHHVG